MWTSSASQANSRNSCGTPSINHRNTSLETHLNALRESESVQQILKAGQHFLQLINETLEISRIEAGELSISIEPVPVEETVLEALDLV